MPRPVLTRQRTPLDDCPAEAFREFAEFVRRVAPRWLYGSRTLEQLMMRRVRQRETVRGRRRGDCPSARRRYVSAHTVSASGAGAEASSSNRPMSGAEPRLATSSSGLGR
jgi:hypothetical protein